MQTMSEQAFKNWNSGYKFCNPSTAIFRKKWQFCMWSETLWPEQYE